jgi:mono/diheme cytochrome c family protein
MLKQPRLRFSRKLPALLIPFAFAAMILMAGELAEAPGNAKAGRDLFVKKGCIRCHSIWRADDKKGPALASVGMGRNLYELCASVWSHWSRMNAVIEHSNGSRQSLTATQFRDIIAYLYYLNYNLEPGEAGRGQKVFNSRGCVQCHATYPLQAAGKPGKALYEMSQFTGPVALAVAIWNHGGSMFKYMEEKRIPWPQFQEKEIADLVAFLRAGSRQRQPEMVVPGEPSRGRELFSSKGCGGCHTSAGGALGLGPDLASSGATASVSALIASLWNHHPRMSQMFASSSTPYPKISQSEMEDLLSYIYWLKAHGLRGNVQNGARLYRVKLCVNCHSPSAGRPAPGAALIQSEATASPYSLLAAIWNHGPRMESLLQEKKLPWPALSGDEMRDLVAYFQNGALSK